MAPCHSMFKHKPPVDMYESRGLFSKLVFLCVTQLITRYIKLYVLMMTHISALLAGPTNRRNLQHNYLAVNTKQLC